jgi:hypothetical protein
MFYRIYVSIKSENLYEIMRHMRVFNSAWNATQTIRTRVQTS